MSTGSFRSVLALLRKNARLKRRNCSSTCCEMVLPLMLVLLIVFGYFLSKEEAYERHNYAGELLDVGAILGGALEALGLDAGDSAGANFTELYNYHGPTPVMDFNQFVQASSFLQSETDAIGFDIGSLDPTFDGLLKLGRIALSPKTSAVEKYRAWMNRTYSEFDKVYIATFENQDAAVDFAQNCEEDERLWALLHFNELEDNTVDVTIRTNFTIVPSTKRIFQKYPRGLDTNYRKYIYSGFLTLQQTVEDYTSALQDPFESHNLLQLRVDVAGSATLNSSKSYDECMNGTTCAGTIGTMEASTMCSSVCDVLKANTSFDVSTDDTPDLVVPSPWFRTWAVPYPTESYTSNRFYNYAGPLMGMIICMSALYPVSQLTKGIVEEKETRMREVLKMMALTDGALNSAWTITYVVMFSTIAILDALLLKATAFGKTEFLLLLLWLMLFFASLVTYSFLLATFFSRAKLSAIVAPIALFATILPRYIFFTAEDDEAVSWKIFAALLSPTCFTFAADQMSRFEGAQLGVSFDTMFEDEGLNFGVCLVLLAFDTVLYWVLSWYLDKVLPSMYGTQRKWYFCFQPSFWTGNQGGSGMGEKVSDEHEQDDSQTVSEAVPPEWEPSVSIQSLRKEFEEGAKVAVHSLSLDMYEGQITALLGHNGAGKTTTISCISGLIPATAGDCLVYGNSIQTKMDAIRRNMGICPQHDVLYAQLTVLEHVELFGTIKGVPSDEVEDAALDMIEKVGLTEKINVMSTALSGGQKRKLSLAISMIGPCQFILCDEPTSGMDPYSRRATWELLRSSKKGRTIVLTTHFMDEADLLGDRIAIMTQGKLACIGAPLFLKKRYGIGYQLTLTKATAQCNEDNVHWFVKRHVVDAERVKSSAGEMVWRLPFEAITQFAALFSELEAEKSSLNVGSYGVSMTTLEECFIRIAEDNLVEGDSDDDYSGSDEEPDSVNPINSHTAPPDASEMSDCPSYASENPPNSGSAQRVEVAMGVTVPASSAVLSKVDTDAVSHMFTTEEMGNVTCTINRTTPRQSPRNMTEALPVKATDASVNMLSKIDDMPGAADHVVTVGNVAQDGLIKQEDDVVVSGLTVALPLNHTSSAPNQPSPIAWQTPRHHHNEALDIKPESISLSVQFKVQFLKRFKVARRDLKAVFYEVGLPVILVFFVLCILFIEFNPAGPSLRLLPDLLGDYGDTDDFVLNSFKEPPTASEVLNSTNARFTGNANPTSYWLGERVLLPQISEHSDRRMGTIVFGDTFNNNKTVTVPAQSLSLLNPTLAALLGVDLALDENGFPNANFTLLFSAADITITDISNPNNSQALNVSDAQDLMDNLGINLNMSEIVEQVNATQTDQEFAVTTDAVSNTLNLNGTNATMSFTRAALDALLPNYASLLLDNDTVFDYEMLADLSIMFNATSAHSLPCYVAQAADARLKAANGGQGSFVVRNHPLPLSSYESAVIGALLALFASLFLLVPFCYLPASYAMYIVKERTTMVKHVMLVSGQNLRVYWAANFAWDLTQYAVIMCACMLVFLCFGSTVFTKDSEYAAGMLVLLSLYGLAAIPLAYCYSFCFDSHSGAQIGIATINFCTGWVTVVTYYIMVQVEDVQAINEDLNYLYSIFPPYILGRSLLAMSEQSFKTDLLNMEKSVFHWDVCGKYYLILCMHIAVYVPLVLIIERFLMTECADKMANCVGLIRLKMGGCCSKTDGDDDDDDLPARPAGENDIEMNNIEALDDDVLRESNHVISGAAEQDSTTVLLINQLCKQYPPRGNQPSKVAVDNLSVSIQRGICFGLLGINGAGKSTTMAMLTGNVNPTSGDALVNGYSIRSDLDKVRSDMGFCPQFDALVESLTATENLVMFAQIKGIPADKTDSVARSLVELVGLSKFANRRSGTYSGGNKRKLSLAIALIGNPSLVLLDEPSTGMDPVARRQMWQTIERTSKGRSVVLTTHSMEECEALCDKVVVMVKGQFRCLGSVQHLKSRFGQGYTVEMKTADLSMADELEKFATEELQATVEERMDGWVKCSVPLHVIELARVFGIIEERKDALQINDYSVSQTTLEQIFVRFARG